MRWRISKPAIPTVLIISGGNDLYGAGAILLLVANALAAEGWSVEVWLPRDGELAERLRSLGYTVRVERLPVLVRGHWHGARVIPTALDFVRRVVSTYVRARRMRGRITAVQAVSAPSIGGIIAARGAKVPLMWSIHEIFKSELETKIFDRLVAMADSVTACSQWVADQLRHSTPRVIYSGADVAAIERLAVDEPFTTRAVPRIVCVGRINQWKGQDVLLNALALLKARGIDFECQIVGSAFAGEESVEQALHELCAKLGLNDRVQFLGHRNDARELMADGDIVVVPSKRPEPFGIVLVEALALGRVLIASDQGGPTEIIEPGISGELFTMADVDALAACLSQVITRPETVRHLSAHARKRAYHFDTGITANNYVDETRRMVEARAS